MIHKNLARSSEAALQFLGRQPPRPTKVPVFTGAEAPPHPADQTRDAAPLRRRAGDRLPQERASDGPQLPPPSLRRPAAVGYNFRLLIRWLRILLCLVLAAILAPPKSATA